MPSRVFRGDYEIAAAAKPGTNKRMARLAIRYKKGKDLQNQDQQSGAAAYRRALFYRSKRSTVFRQGRRLLAAIDHHSGGQCGSSPAVY
ncbi:MAG: hypothetical protein M3342_01555 [Bacteroidota bacterium]|nr:hypothetical protein [Bacteroidota bacterium]